MYTCQLQGKNYYIRTEMIDALMRYLEHGIMPGSFLTAILGNKLVEALGRADEENLQNIPAYGCYLYNEMPENAWGNEDLVAKWCQDKRHKATTNKQED